MQHHEVGESIYQLGAEDTAIGEDGEDRCSETPKSTSVSTLGGALDASQGVVVEIDQMAQQEGDRRPFLILDLRSEDEYNKARINSGMHLWL